MLKATIVAVSLFIFLILPQNEVRSSPESDIVNKWAESFGNELWELAQKMTKSKEIRERYKTSYAKVQEKNGTLLIADIVASIGRMLNRKMDAVKCIVNKSEEYAEAFHRNNSVQDEFEYYSSKYSYVNDLNLTNREEYTDFEQESMEKFSNMSFEADTHFYDLEVNTTHSSVHVPTNVYDKGPEEWEFIQWSEILDEVFTQNYQSDPALSWQYFGSNVGIMRHFPAMSWNRNNTDTYDCRKRSWYIETATCSKDVVILLDNSGSMTGYRNFIARHTIKNLLGTFSNNDFINILNYSKTTNGSIIKCFENILVQATPDNIKAFNEAVLDLQPDGYGNVTVALDTAFKLLEKYRDIRKCNESSTGCNQAIMLITDGVPGNATETFQKYNEYGSNRTAPVRVFTYLLGKEVTKVKEIQLYACLNRGFYSHIQTLDEISGEVLKYVNVIAAPLVLQKLEHPPTWTHAYIGEANQTDTDKKKVDKTKTSRLMIAVGVPAFNLSSYGGGNYTGRPTLLGVAGTDIQLEDIRRLALPYKLGVNGYAFIVSNNGYVLLHPDLRPIDPKFPERVKENYNSMDLTEVEQFIEDDHPRVPSARLQELRRGMVEAKTNKVLNVSVKFHYDIMRRVADSAQDYYFTPIPHTPFSLGIALPHAYADTSIKVGDEIQRNIYTKINISDFFVGDNWKVHPDWVYCRYHYLEGHEEIMKTSEDELRHFLKKIVEKDWEWTEQYEPDAENDREKDTDELNCGRKTLGSEAYYCNKELVQMVVFDAKVTNDSYQSWTFKGDAEREIILKYNATVRFVSTMSGLTRWQFIFGEVEVDYDTEFGDLYSTSLDESWYKSAVLQYGIDEHSFVYSVPHFDDGEKDENSTETDIKVTASMAIFPRDGGKKAPACVVGFQFSHQLMVDRFMELTSMVDCNDCIKSCGSDEQDCYVLDNNGYILISEDNMNDTGRFFGEIEGAIMEVMVEKSVYRRITVYDYQGLCKNETRGNETNTEGSAGGLISPFKFLLLALKWIFTEMVIELSRITMWVQSAAIEQTDYDIRDYDYADFGKTQKVTTASSVPKGGKISVKGKSAESLEAEEYFRARQEKLAAQVVTVFYSCDKKADLYVTDETWINKNGLFSSPGEEEKSRPFHVARIPHSNLILVVINQMKGSSTKIDLTTKMNEMNTWLEYNATHPCYKIYLNDLPRRRLDECFTEHLDEEEMAYCGSVSRIKLTMLLLLPSLLSIRLLGFT